jgi:hypothetical protein
MVSHIKKIDGPIKNKYYPIIGHTATFQLAVAIHSGADHDQGEIRHPMFDHCHEVGRGPIHVGGIRAAAEPRYNVDSGFLWHMGAHIQRL